MIAPRKTKYRVTHLRKLKGNSTSGVNIEYGDMALVALENEYVTPNQLEAVRRVIANTTKRTAKVWIRVFPDQPITAKGAGTRMGSGKGPVKAYVAPVKAGRVLIEIGGVNSELGIKALTLAQSKLGVKTKILLKK
ncbi:MAG: 50S ribosomal protein L16 [Candidatus Dojkabacteria bacterium]|nr:50S ribosomal protein L16 [Candidatus Dojkabacteria bacterium]